MAVLIAGGGPAGAAAAIAARLNGADVSVFERHSVPRHKVCGEFLSPYCADLLDLLQSWPDFANCSPLKIGRSVLHLGGHTKSWTLSEPAWGLSRLAFDRLLLAKAVSLGAVLHSGRVFHTPSESPTILASGRRGASPSADRLFGFKAHFSGPSTDSVELFFSDSSYAGVSGVEDGITNVCAIAPESLLRKYDFHFDEFLHAHPPIADRLRPLHRQMNWIATGPLCFADPATNPASPNTYPAGDALGFIDPYTGSGIMNALWTGRLAGIAAARNTPPEDHLRTCRDTLGRGYWISSVFRHLLDNPGAAWLTRCIPGRLLFRLTRANGSCNSIAPGH